MQGRETSRGNVPRMSRHDWWGVVLEAPDARTLAHFYSALLGWPIDKEDAQDAAIAPEDGVAYLAFQTSPGYLAPAWPEREGAQQIQSHLDFEVSDLDAAVEHALELGARLAEYQPQPDVRVLLDPVGHPFCLYLG